MAMLTKPQKISFLLGVLLGGVLGVTRMASAVEIGQKAPDFTLQSTEGKKINLGQFRGKKHVLLEFYVADFGAT